METELQAIYDSAKSFYRKAIIKEDKTSKNLYSYHVFIASIDKQTRNIIISPSWDKSTTTIRHLREFLEQNRFFSGTKEQIKNYYNL